MGLPPHPQPSGPYLLSPQPCQANPLPPTTASGPSGAVCAVLLNASAETGVCPCELLSAWALLPSQLSQADHTGAGMLQRQPTHRTALGRELEPNPKLQHPRSSCGARPCCCADLYLEPGLQPRLGHTEAFVPLQWLACHRLELPASTYQAESFSSAAGVYAISSVPRQEGLIQVRQGTNSPRPCLPASNTCRHVGS